MSHAEQNRMLQNDHLAQEREKVLDWISTLGTESKHHAVRMPRVAETSEWVMETEEFKTWRKGAEAPSVLWCTCQRISLPLSGSRPEFETCPGGSALRTSYKARLPLE